jgi:hypothetical protein
MPTTIASALNNAQPGSCLGEEQHTEQGDKQQLGARPIRWGHGTGTPVEDVPAETPQREARRPPILPDGGRSCSGRAQFQRPFAPPRL